MKANCVLFTARGQVALDQCTIPDPGPDEVLVRSLFSCISPATELRVLDGLQPGINLDSFPVIPGYSLVGTVISAGKRVPHALVGSTVLCAGTAKADRCLAWGGHIALAVAPASAVIPVAPTTSPVDTILCHLAGIALRGVRLSRARETDAVAIIGLGLIGQLAVRLFTHAGVKVLAAGLSDHQVKCARQGGATAVKVEADSLAALRELLPRGADVVVDATGRPSVIPLALDLIRRKAWMEDDPEGPRLVLLGSHPGDLKISHDLAFDRELSLIWPRYTQRSDVEQVLELVEKHGLVLSDLIGATVQAAEAPEIYQRLAQSRKNLITVALQWAAPEKVQLEANPTHSSSIFGWMRGKKT